MKKLKAKNSMGQNDEALSSKYRSEVTKILRDICSGVLKDVSTLNDKNSEIIFNKLQDMSNDTLSFKNSVLSTVNNQKENWKKDIKEIKKEISLLNDTYISQINHLTTTNKTNKYIIQSNKLNKFTIIIMVVTIIFLVTNIILKFV